MIQIQWTCATIEEAKKISRSLVEKKWVACANIIPNVLSIYEWEGKVEESQEVKVLFKTKDQLFKKVRDHIIENGSYEVPEVSKIVISDCNPKYEEWLFGQLSK